MDNGFIRDDRGTLGRYRASLAVGEECENVGI